MDEKKRIAAAELLQIARLLDLTDVSEADIRAFTAGEDGSEYAVWHIASGNREYVLKRAKDYEIEVYKSFFCEKKPYAPAFFGSIFYDGDEYFLMEYCAGEALQRCERGKLEIALNALIAMQDEFWQREELYNAAVTLENSLEAIDRRGQYLGSELLEAVYGEYVQIHKSTPRTLCHTDLLPINVLVGERAVFIDWEYGGMLPYPTSIARLIAHGREDENAYLYMKEADRAFAIDYYYSNFIQKHGISYQEYLRTLDYFLFYEYCEWIMIGNRYDMREDERYIYSLKKAADLAEKLLS